MMSFLWPLGLAFGSLAGIVVILHMLKMKRREVDISSALLWKKAIEDLRANAPFQRLRKSLLLLLQLLAVFALAIALARPVKRMPRDEGRRIAILVDVSASMGAREAGGKTRVDLAREEARKVVDGLGPSDSAAIVAFDARARALATLTSSQPVLRQALAGLAPTDVGSDAREGLALAAAILREAQGGEILLVSDGGFPPPGDVDLRGAPVRYIPIGEPRENAGITGLDVRRLVDESEAIEVLARVTSHADGPRKLTVTLYREDDGAAAKLVDAKEVEVAPDATVPVVFSLPAAAQGYHRVAIEREGGSIDALALDDSAGFVIAPPEKMDALLVTPGNYFLERLLAVDPRIGARKLPPADVVAASHEVEAVAIFDRTPPAELPPGGSIFIGCLPPGRKPMREQPIRDPQIAEWDALHPTARFSSFGEINIVEAMPMALGPSDRAILSSTQGPLIAEVREGRARAIVICFDLMKSDWPLKASFPLFLHNALRYVAGRTKGDRALLRTGEPIEIEAAARDAEITVTDPAGAARKLRTDAVGRATLPDARIAGRYRVDPGSRPPYSVAVDLLDARETDVRPVPKIDLGERPVEVVQAGLEAPRPLWRFFALGALAFVLVEWWVYNRRAYL
jgi:hypothetical protein